MQDVKKLKKAICEIGDRIYKRGFAAANDGNISVRLNETEVLCTPTMHCKGFLKPKDICLVDMDGKSDAGKNAGGRVDGGINPHHLAMDI